MTPEQTRLLDAINTFRQFQRVHLDAAANLNVKDFRGIHGQMDRMLGQIHRSHDLIPSVPDFSKLMAPSTTNRRLEDLINQATASSRVLGDLSRVHQSWLARIDRVSNIVDQVQAVSKMALIDVTSRLTLSEQCLAGINFDQLHARLSLPASEFQRALSPINEMVRAYEGLASSISTYSELTHFPAFTLPGATREILTTYYALQGVSAAAPTEIPTGEQDSEFRLVEDINEEISECEALLQEVDSRLPPILRGAQDAIEGNNADRDRHALSSLRELWNHLLRLLSPNDAVSAWTQDAEHYHDGRPTRRARVLYICRHFSSPPLAEFVMCDTKALIALIDILSRVHELNPALSDSQLRVLLLRTRSWVTYILRIHEG